MTRTEQRAGDAPADVTVLARQDIDRSPSQTLDDLLRQVPGFSLFRRTSSLVGHPTTQGVSLRGIGPSGTSRALVLLDGVPINDPFGGWVYWDRIPLQGVEQVEVVRGGGSSAWGNYALGGVINIITRKPVERAALFDGSYGNHNTLNLDGIVSEVQGPFRLSLEGNYFNTDGYPIVKASDRGSIDIDATSQHSTFNGRLELVLSPDLSFYVRGNHYDENRGNGTPLQNNDTEAGSFATGGRLRTGDGSDWSFNLYGDFQKFTSTFSTQAANRNSETLALDQRVPSTSVGGALQWSRRFGSHLVLAGGDFRWIEGETHEKVFNAGVLHAPARCGRPAGRGRRLRAGRVHALAAVGDRGRRARETTGWPTTASAPTRRRRRASRRARASRTTTGWARARAWPRSGTPRPPPTCAPPCTRASGCPPSTSCTACSGCGTT